jgi:hypothetical protein
LAGVSCGQWSSRRVDFIAPVGGSLLCDCMLRVSEVRVCTDEGLLVVMVT